MIPPLPSFLPARPTAELALAPSEPPPSLIPQNDPLPTSSRGHGAGPSTSLARDTSTCQICGTQTAKYTCPRCSTRTCCVECSKTHKMQLDCNGQRDPTKFVSLSQFGQGDWGDDYAYLESGRRRIAEWGVQMPAGAAPSSSSSSRGGRGRDGANHQSQRHQPHSYKVEGLRRELERRGIEVEFMPEGMGRRKLNQSSWNPKTQSLHLTIQLSVPTFLLNPSSTPFNPDSKTLTHPRVPVAAPSQPSPTLSSLLPPSIQPDSTGEPDITVVLPFHPSSSNPTPIDILLRKPRPMLFFPPLTLDRPILECFKGMSWVEFPVLQVWKASDWEAKVESGEVVLVRSNTISEGRGEKRKVDTVPTFEAGETTTDVVSPERVDSGEDIKRPRILQAPTQAGQGLLGLESYDSDDNDDEVVEVEALDLQAGPAEDEEITADDIHLMQALGAAAAADMQ